MLVPTVALITAPPPKLVNLYDKLVSHLTNINFNSESLVNIIYNHVILRKGYRIICSNLTEYTKQERPSRKL
ncbi:unnamed protein product [Nezara viridula]|uniref:Uncharacterized protein n=1 Tax=Nezara viridula TaxID=85310 RepID=A0A9P0H5Q3_NEZVI|nr:unnamed protein product [Nezara viridula]